MRLHNLGWQEQAFLFLAHTPFLGRQVNIMAVRDSMEMSFLHTNSTVATVEGTKNRGFAKSSRKSLLAAPG
jgi:hypothetical protein